jgi:hypothetical protein
MKSGLTLVAIALSLAIFFNLLGSILLMSEGRHHSKDEKQTKLI